jgi:hypothetical protein
MQHSWQGPEQGRQTAFGDFTKPIARLPHAAQGKIGLDALLDRYR